jgi:dUTPase
MRIVQIIISPYIKANWTEINELTNTTRGISGFGSTGTF